MSNSAADREGVLERLSPYLHDAKTRCPYGLPHEALYRIARFPRIPDEMMWQLLAAGFRRNGNTVYTMDCPDCRGCRPIRIPTRSFQPNRNQRRTLGRNRDLSVVSLPISPSREKLDLLQKFFDHRYAGRHNSATDYYSGFFLNSSGFSLELEFRQADRLVGVSVIDVGSIWMNAVYFFFDPEESGRSLGTFNILQLVELCRQHDLDELYLGYWIENIAAMSYKRNFLPHQLLEGTEWKTILP